MGKSRERRRKAANMLLLFEGIRNLFVVVVCVGFGLRNPSGP